MAEFGWAYTTGAISGSGGISGSIQWREGPSEITGSDLLVWDRTESTLYVTGNVNVAGTLYADEINVNTTNRLITNISSTGSTEFGDSITDTHLFVGKMMVAPTASVEDVGARFHVKTIDTDNIGAVLIDHDEAGGYNALKVDSESTSHPAVYVTGFKTLYAQQDIADGYGAKIYRNIAEAGSNPLVYLHDDHTSNTQTTLTVNQDGTGLILDLQDGGVSVLNVSDGGRVSGSNDLHMNIGTFEGTLSVTGAISGSGELNIVGATTLESTLHVSGAISGAAGITGSSLQINDSMMLNANGILSASLAVQSLSFAANDGGTKNVVITGDGTIIIAGGAADTTCLSASGDVNIVGKGFIENTLHVSGAISGASGITGSSLQINDTITLNANGNITNVNSLSASSELFAGTVLVNDLGTNTVKLLGTGEISGSGPLNIVGATTLESTLHVSGAISGALGITGSSLQINDTIFLNANGTISNATDVSASAGFSGSYALLNKLSVNQDGTKPILLAGGQITCTQITASNTYQGVGFYANVEGTNSARMLGTGEISASGDLNIVGAATLESTLNVSGAITTALGVTASAGFSGSYAHVNNLAINDGGTKNIRMNGDGTLVIAGGAADTTCLSASGDVNIIGKTYLENTLHVSGAISGALGITGSSLQINDTITLNANGNITNVGTVSSTNLSASAGITGSYALVNNLSVNQGGTKTIALAGDGTGLFGGKLTVLDEISGSGVLNIVGAATLENTLHVSGAIHTAVGITGSTGISGSYAHFNNISVNDGGTKNIRLNGDGTIVIAGGAAGTTCLSASGDVNIVGNGFVEGDFNVTGTLTAGTFSPSSVSSSGELNIVGAATLESTLHVSGAISGAVGITGSSLQINDTILLNANGKISNVTDLSASLGLSALDFFANNGGTNQVKILGTGEISGSGPLNIVGAATLENTLHVSGAISGASGITGSSLQINDTITLNANGNITNVGTVAATALTASAGVSGSYAHVNNLAINDGGTKNIRLNGDGTLVIAGGTAGTTCLSASGDVNIVGNTFIEGSLNVTGAFALSNVSSSGELNIVGASTLESTLHVSGAISGAVGITGSSLQINDTITLNANGNITNVTSLSASTELFAGTIFVNDLGTNSVKILGTGEISGSGPLNIVGPATFEAGVDISGSMVLVGAATDVIAVDINSIAVDANVIDIAAPALTTSDGLSIVADALTTGKCARFYSNSSTTDNRGLVSIINDHASATGAIPLAVRNDAIPTAGRATVQFQDTSANTEPLLQLLNANAATDKPPILRFKRSDATAEADDMSLGQIDFMGVDAGNADTQYAAIQAFATDVTAGDEAGELRFSVFAGGTAGTAGLKTAFKIGREDTAGGDAPMAIFLNPDAIDLDVAMHGDNIANMFRMDAANDRIGIGVGSPGALLEIQQGSSGGDIAFLIDNDDTDQIAMSIEAANIDADVIDIVADAVTTARAIDIQCDGLTTGSIIGLDSNSSTTDTRNLMFIVNNHASATGATNLYMRNDAGVGIMKAEGKSGAAMTLTIKEVAITISTAGAVTTSSNFFPALAVPLALSIRVTTAISAGHHITKLGTGGIDDLWAGAAGDGGALNDGVLDEQDDLLTIAIAPFAGPYSGAGGSAAGINAAQDLVITCAGTATGGVIRAVLHYWAITPPTS